MNESLNGKRAVMELNTDLIVQTCVGYSLESGDKNLDSMKENEAAKR